MMLKNPRMVSGYCLWVASGKNVDIAAMGSGLSVRILIPVPREIAPPGAEPRNFRCRSERNLATSLAGITIDPLARHKDIPATGQLPG